MKAFISVSTIVECAAAAFGVSVADIMRHCRDRALVRPRQAACLIAHQLTDLSYPQIGRVLGRDHTTIMHSVEAATELCEKDADFANRFAAARGAAAIIANSSFSDELADIDATAVAERVCSNPMREALHVSARQTAAIAARLLNLEDAAGAAFQLLSIHDADRTPEAHATSIKAATERLASALHSLGYSQPEGEDHDSQHANAVA